jgi:hypothetical protein
MSDGSGFDAFQEEDPELQPVHQASGKLPEKEFGKHRWVARSLFTVTPTEAAQAHAGGEMVALTIDKMILFGVGCIDCDGSYADVRVDPCFGEPAEFCEEHST